MKPKIEASLRLWQNKWLSTFDYQTDVLTRLNQLSGQVAREPAGWPSRSVKSFLNILTVMYEFLLSEIHKNMENIIDFF